jgi:hypothetical protein
MTRTKHSRTNSPKTKELLTDKNRKKMRNPYQLYIQGLGLFKILETSGEAKSFFSCLILLKVDAYLTCETDYQAKALEESKDDMRFYLEFFNR